MVIYPVKQYIGVTVYCMIFVCDP